MTKHEALVDAVGYLNGAFTNPDSQAYKLRNPLMVRSFARPGKHESSTTGYRIFTSMLAGYRAALYDLELKLEGKSRAGIKTTDALGNLLRVYEIKSESDMDKVVGFLRKALGDPSISASTPLSFFAK